MKRAVALLVAIAAASVAGCEGGEPLSGPRELAASDEPAVVRIDSERTSCSGALIAPRVVLTARHCIRSMGDGIRVHVGSAPPLRAIDSEVAREADLGLLLLDAAPVGITPLRLPGAGWVPPARKGVSRLVGFGRSSAEREGALPKHVAEAHLVDEDGDKLYFRAAPKAVCSGDSGGPILARDGTGAELLVAVAVSTMHLDDALSRRCGAVLTATRVDRHDAFIRAFLSRAIAGPGAERPLRLVGAKEEGGITRDTEDRWPASKLVYLAFLVIVVGLLVRRLFGRRRGGGAK